MTNPDPELVAAVLAACDRLSANYRYIMRAGERLHVTVPPGTDNRAVYASAEAVLMSREIFLDWRNHPDELIRRTVHDTLWTVAQWFPREQAAELFSGPAFAVRDWRPDGMACPLCQNEPCNEGCPLQRVSTAHRFDGAAIVAG